MLRLLLLALIPSLGVLGTADRVVAQSGSRYQPPPRPARPAFRPSPVQRPAAGSSTRVRPTPTRPATNVGRLGLEGFCPVAATENGAWVRGSTRYTSTFDGVAYRFPNAEAKAIFDARPERYVPALRGDSVVAYRADGKRVPGRIRFAARSRTTMRVFLFANADERRTFLADPTAFVDAGLGTPQGSHGRTRPDK